MKQSQPAQPEFEAKASQTSHTMTALYSLAISSRLSKCYVIDTLFQFSLLMQSVFLL